jgi:hypothetical protein
MRFAYLTTAYHELEQLSRLQRSLAAGDPEALRFIQFDVSSPSAARAREIDAVVRYTRRGINWGDGSYLDSLLESLAALREFDWDWLVLLSGQDHPIRPLEELHNAIEGSGAVALSGLSASAASVSDGDPEPISRYFYRYASPRQTWPSWLRKASLVAARRVEPMIGERVRLQPRPRGAAPALGRRTTTSPFSAHRRCYQGSEYVAMSRVAVTALLDLVDDEPALINHLGRTFIPTEAFFATGLRWIFGDDVANETLHYVRYGGNANPKMLTIADRGDIAASRFQFARKFADDSAWVEQAFPQ